MTPAPDEGAPEDGRADQGGGPACLAARICPECGSVLGEDPHRGGCPVTEASLGAGR